MNKNRTTRFLGGVFLGYANMAIAMVVGLWMTPFLLRKLGQHDYGVWLVGLQVLAYFSLLDFGVLAILPRELLTPRVKHSGPGSQSSRR